ncbi:hypothetical protein MRX96_002798 [Rhipicephalus microplus]
MQLLCVVLPRDDVDAADGCDDSGALIGCPYTTCMNRSADDSGALWCFSQRTANRTRCVHDAAYCVTTGSGGAEAPLPCARVCTALTGRAYASTTNLPSNLFATCKPDSSLVYSSSSEGSTFLHFLREKKEEKKEQKRGLDFLRLQIAYLRPIVDVFVIADKTNRLLADIERTFGGQQEYTKIVYLPLNNRNNSTARSEDMLQHLFWKRLSDFRLDDLLVWADLTTVPFAEVLLFLKLYDGYSEPVYLNVRQLAYSFLWEQKRGSNSSSSSEHRESSQTPFVSTFAVLSVLCRYNLTCAMPPKENAFTAAQLEAFTKNHGFKTVQPVDKNDLGYLAPRMLLEKPGSLWYLVPLHLKTSQV